MTIGGGLFSEAFLKQLTKVELLLMLKSAQIESQMMMDKI